MNENRKSWQLWVRNLATWRGTPFSCRDHLCSAVVTTTCSLALHSSIGEGDPIPPEFLKRLLQLSPPKTIQFSFFTKKCTESPKAILHITHWSRRRNKPYIPVPLSKATCNCGDKTEPPKIVQSRDADGKMWLHPKVLSSNHTFPITPASCDSFTPQILVTLPQRR